MDSRKVVKKVVGMCQEFKKTLPSGNIHLGVLSNGMHFTKVLQL